MPVVVVRASSGKVWIINNYLVDCLTQKPFQHAGRAFLLLLNEKF